MRFMFLNGYNFKKTISFWAIILIIIVNAWYGNNLKRWKKNEIIDQDVTHYYAYFPATFIYHDWRFDFLEKLPGEFKGRIWLLDTPDGKPVLKMTMGLSILWLPFELLAHIYAKCSHFNADGYSLPYSLAIFVAALFYLFLGLYYLRKLILKFFDELTAFVILTLVVFGTNLMHYVIWEPGMTHVYNFSLITIFIYMVDKWLAKPGWINSVIIGAISGLIVLIRPINAIVILIPLLWNVKSFKEFVSRFRLFAVEWRMVFLIILAAIIVLIPQLIYWKTVTGNWIYYSYQDERFFFTHPHILDGLFSFRKGWFVYTPVMAIATIGFIFLFKRNRGIAFPVLLTMLFAIYGVFSWWCWWYGGSFGSRPMIDFYGLMALPLAAFVFKFSKSKFLVKSLVAMTFGLLILFNQFQMIQYRSSLLHWDSMTKEAYVRILLRRSWPSDYDLLIKSPDYEKAKKGETEYQFP